MHALLTELKVIGSLRQHERVNSRGDILDIDTTSGIVPQSVRRFFAGESRDHNVSKIVAVMDQGVAELERQCSVRGAEIDQLSADIVSALQGVRHLQVTYRDDSKTVARLQVCIDATERKLARASARKSGGDHAPPLNLAAENVERFDGAHIAADCARFVLRGEARGPAAPRRAVMEAVKRPCDNRTRWSENGAAAIEGAEFVHDDAGVRVGDTDHKPFGFTLP